MSATVGDKVPAVLQPSEEDIQQMLQAQVHIGTKNCDKTMEPYRFKRRADGINIIHLGKTYEKLVLAARIIATIQNPEDICVISARPYGHRAVLKFAAFCRAIPIAGRFTPGNFTNYITKSFKEPRLIIVTDPRVDHQAIREAAYVNIPVIAFCDTDASLKFVDVAIPCNNKARHAVGLMWYLLCREVLRLRGDIPRGPWEVIPDLFFYRDPEEIEAEQKEKAEAEAAANAETAAPAAAGGEWEAGATNIADAFAPDGATAGDWAAEPAIGWPTTEEVPAADAGGWD